MKINKVGISRYTRIKQEHFKTILTTHARIFQYIKRKYEWVRPHYLYIDMNAGPGSYEDEKGDEIKGSPLIFLDVADKLNLSFKAKFIENNKENLEDLHITIAEIWCSMGEPDSWDDDTINYIKKNHNKVIGELCTHSRPKQYGLIYNDPSGELPSFDALRLFADCYKRADILINCPATTLKRSPKKISILDYLKGINKKYWLIRELYFEHQWTFLIGTNWIDFPEFEKIGLYRKDSKEGQRILDKVMTTASEEREKLDQAIIDMHMKGADRDTIVKELGVTNVKVTLTINRRIHGNKTNQNE